MNIQFDARYEFPSQTEDLDTDWAIKELAAELQRLNVDVNVRLLSVPYTFDDGGR